MQLWPPEYDDLRAEAREMAATIAEIMPNEPLSADPDENVRRQRAMLQNFEQESPAGTDAVIEGVPCRVFRTEVAPRAVYFDIHGGGMMLGSARLNDLQNAERAERLGFAAVSVDYRLAPEHPFPAGADDCLAVAKWLIEQAESEFGTAQLLIGGESAGAYYAALTLLRVRDELGSVDRFRAANLVFGAYDLSRTPSQRGTRPFSGFDILTPDGIEFFHDSYLPGRTPEERRSPAISPLYAELHDLPPAIFTVGTDDHLLDDSLFMATRWAAHGNATELAVFPDCCHGFSMFPTSLAKRARERVDAFLERCISDPA